MTELINEYHSVEANINSLKEQLTQITEKDSLVKDLMIAQLKAMETYISIVAIRIGLSPQQTPTIEEIDELPND